MAFAMRHLATTRVLEGLWWWEPQVVFSSLIAVCSESEFG